MKKIFLILAFLIPGLTFAALITVPSAPGSGYTLLSTASGGYTPTIASSVGGNIFGVGSSTPWAILSVASSTYNYLSPLFVLSTSTDSFGQLLHVWATSSTLSLKSRASVSNPNIQHDSGARFSIGSANSLGGGPLLDQLQVEGRLNEGSWHFFKCYPLSQTASIITNDTSSGTNLCHDFSFQEDNTAQIFGNIENGVPYLRMNFNTIGVVDDGAMLYTGNQATANAPIDIASTTPVFETVARIVSPANASTTNLFIGFTGIPPLSTVMEQRGTGAGCFFHASSTQHNWWATCSTGSATTTLDTGFASTTDSSGTAGDWYLFRVDVGSTLVKFYMGSRATTTREVARISTNIPTGTGQRLWPMLAVVRTSLTGSTGIDIASVRLWVRFLGALGF